MASFNLVVTQEQLAIIARNPDIPKKEESERNGGNAMVNAIKKEFSNAPFVTKLSTGRNETNLKQKKNKERQFQHCWH